MWPRPQGALGGAGRSMAGKSGTCRTPRRWRSSPGCARGCSPRRSTGRARSRTRCMASPARPARVVAHGSAHAHRATTTGSRTGVPVASDSRGAQPSVIFGSPSESVPVPERSALARPRRLPSKPHRAANRNQDGAHYAVRMAQGSLRRVGHKGADLIAPGNTIASFDAALAAGVDMIEFDVLPAPPPEWRTVAFGPLSGAHGRTPRSCSLTIGATLPAGTPHAAGRTGAPRLRRVRRGRA